MSNTNELPKEIYLNPEELKTIVEYEWIHDASVWQNPPNKNFVPYILKSFHESEMERLQKENQEACKQAYLRGRRDANSSMT